MTSKPSTEEEFETVTESRVKIVFDTIGDVWKGYYEGTEMITDPNTAEEYKYLNFRDDDGEAFTTSASYILNQAFEKIAIGMYVRIELTGLAESKRGNDLKQYKVQVRK